MIAYQETSELFGPDMRDNCQAEQIENTHISSMKSINRVPVLDFTFMFLLDEPEVEIKEVCASDFVVYTKANLSSKGFQ